MVVVPQDLLESLRYNQQQKMGVVGQQLVTLDSEMKEILQENIPDHEKAQKYFQTLQKYMTTKENATKVVEEKEPIQPADIVPSPIDDIPTRHKKKAEQIFNWMKRVAPDITWNTRGEVRGIPGSNIADLITELSKSKSTTTPTGFTQFTELVKEANIPQTLVSNKEHWQTYFKPDAVRADDIYQTPRAEPLTPVTPSIRRTITPVYTPVKTTPPTNTYIPKRTWLSLDE